MVSGSTRVSSRGGQVSASPRPRGYRTSESKAPGGPFWGAPCGGPPVKPRRWVQSLARDFGQGSVGGRKQECKLTEPYAPLARRSCK